MVFEASSCYPILRHWLEHQHGGEYVSVIDKSLHIPYLVMPPLVWILHCMVSSPANFQQLSVIHCH